MRSGRKGQPYDWFNLDDMGSLIHSEEFASTLKEAMARFFFLGGVGGGFREEFGRGVGGGLGGGGNEV